MSDKVQLIKEEIEKRIENLKFSIENNAFTKKLKLDLEGNITTLNSLLQFINSIPEEPVSENLESQYKSNMRYQHAYTQDELLKTKSKDLEGEIKSWIPAHIKGGNEYMRKVAIEWSETVARHFAEWQRKKDQETIELAEDHAMLAGMNKMKEEMMENAVEATIFSELKDSDGSLFRVESDRFKMNGVKLGDRIKVIPIKTEQQ